MRLFALSDLHTDFPENWRLVQEFANQPHPDDALIVAGDIADRIERIRDTLALLRASFGQVYYVPGNHDLWVRRSTGDSLARFWELIALCDQFGITTRISRLRELWIVPLFSWYRPDFADDPDNQPADLEAWADFAFCRWPEAIGDVASYFAGLNTPLNIPHDGPVLTFSHFVPRRDLLPPADRLRFKGLPWVAGTDLLDWQIHAAGAHIHIFGHSHINGERTINGVRYLQNALGYPRERRTTAPVLKVVWEWA